MKNIEITLIRKYSHPEYTIGKLFYDNQYLCDTVEDRDRDKNKDGDLDDEGEGKIYGETAIPYGLYKLTVTMSPKFGRELILVNDVKHFQGIRFHRGGNEFNNWLGTAKNSHGCIIPGENKVKGGVIRSREYEEMLTNFVKLHEKIGNDVWLRII